MKLQCILAAVAVAFLCAVAQPIMSQSAVEIAKCVNTITNNRSTTVNISGNKFKCPGQIIVAEENEAQALLNSSNANAYFKGALIHNRTLGADDRVKYFVVVENWADPQRCTVLVGPMTVNGGMLSKVGPGSLSGSWEDVAQLLVTKLAYKWADSFEYSNCRRGVFVLPDPPPLAAYIIAGIEPFSPGSEYKLVRIRGNNFKAGEEVSLKITSKAGNDNPFTESQQTTADSIGGIDFKYSGSGGGVCSPGITTTFQVQGTGVSSAKVSNVSNIGC